MKKIYAIYCTVELTKKPDWLDKFCSTYNRPHPLHITLKQMAYIDDIELTEIKAILEDILERTKISSKKLQIVFDKLVLDEQDDDGGKGWVYIFASKRNDSLYSLQEQVRTRLAKYSDYFFKNSYQYEHEFNPHITIAGELDAKTFVSATSELPEEVHCVREVASITLSCVQEPTLVEANNSNNLIVYNV
jgi:2'-5' RNA ligase